MLYTSPEERHYKNMISSERANIQRYDRYLKQLNKIQKQLLTGLDDEILSAVKANDDCIESLEAAVRHNSIFSQNIDLCRQAAEPGVMSDGLLTSAYQNIQSEINRLNNLKNEADSRLSGYYTGLRQVREQEEQA